ncbi:MAG TPA: hypothetical protein VFS35_08750, partial [Terrimicrobiaceae bacterium]|nr:hypothetical protein [Terrimicrobiaceae bacterium]
IDQQPKKPSRGILQKLFGGGENPSEASAKEDDRVTLARRKLQEVVEPAGLALIYQTAGGLRVILADRTVDPSSEEAIRLLEHLGSDPLYVRLCRNQKSFRARLTPKPWRCGYHAPPERWPFLDAKSQESFRAWEDEYHRRIGDYSVSRLLERWGDGKAHPEIEPLLTLHDQFSRVDRTDLCLA